MSRRASLLMLAMAAYLLGWYVEGGSLQLIQLVAVALVVCAGVFALLGGHVRRTPLSPIEWILGAAFVSSSVVALVLGNTVSVLYGIMFTMALISLAHIARDRTLDQLLTAFRYVYIALLASILLVQPSQFYASVIGTVEYAVGLVRFTPLGMHPNLSGLVYGGGALLFFQHALSVEKAGAKLISIILACLCIGVLMAASARASMLALGITCAVAGCLLSVFGSWRVRLPLLLVTAAGAGLAMVRWPQISEYLKLMLDVESSTRGLESGATGRTEIWQEGVELILSDPVKLLTGRGVRGAGPEVIGFPVESSYINLALESGAIFMVLIVGRLLMLCGGLLYRATYTRNDGYRQLLMGLLLLFILIQSIFNRYLIAIGNPFSLLILLICIYADSGSRKFIGAKVPPKYSAMNPARP